MGRVGGAERAGSKGEFEGESAEGKSVEGKSVEGRGVESERDEGEGVEGTEALTNKEAAEAAEREMGRDAHWSGKSRELGAAAVKSAEMRLKAA